ncbi:MAG TPA: hypothetical protein VGK20_04545 [Candidatus Binatia bacterium]
MKDTVKLETEFVSRRGSWKSALVAAATVAIVTAGGPILVLPALAAKGDCSQPLSSGTGPSAADCGFVLQASVGSKTCELCVCDANGSGTLTTVDALVCLKVAVGQNVALSCPSCSSGTSTTTTLVERVSTTSTSTTSTTTTMPLHCSSNSDCSSLPTAFRCNPNDELCEKPCFKNIDCHDFYECNLTTHYCQAPAPLF